MAPWEGASKREWRMEMRVSARVLKPIIVLAVAAASFGCIAPAYAEDVTANVTSRGDSRVVVDVDLNVGAPDGGSDGKAWRKAIRVLSASAAETDNTIKAFESLMAANGIIIKAAFFFFCLPILLVSAMILIFYALMEWLHERRRP